jgi:hypothetical protein
MNSGRLVQDYRGPFQHAGQMDAGNEWANSDLMHAENLHVVAFRMAQEGLEWCHGADRLQNTYPRRKQTYSVVWNSGFIDSIVVSPGIWLDGQKQ